VTTIVVIRGGTTKALTACLARGVHHLNSDVLRNGVVLVGGGFLLRRVRVSSVIACLRRAFGAAAEKHDK
jgi:actin-like ATPase involved in cell morphogenesis